MASIKRLGRQTVMLSEPPKIVAAASVVGPKEGEGPLGKEFDMIFEDELWGEKTWEKAESKMVREVFGMLLSKSSKGATEIQYVLAGDLLNQCIASSFGLRDSKVPFFGLFGACSTMAESISLGSMLIDGGYADNVICLTSSHFCSAERQFRLPLELGSQRPPTAQWTVTGCGGVVLSSTGSGPVITHVTTGKIVDLGIKDANNMGSAMAPAAADTIFTHFVDTGRTPADYDLIVTGDLGLLGKRLCEEFLLKNGYEVKNLIDCGVEIYDSMKQDTHMGGSGCGCCATVLAAHLYPRLQRKELNRILFVATGALLSPTSSLQNESIPSIAHAVCIQAEG